MVVARGWGEGWNGELLFNGQSFSLGKNEKVLEMTGSDGYMLMYLMPLNCTLKMLNFVMYVLELRTGFQTYTQGVKQILSIDRKKYFSNNLNIY